MDKALSNEKVNKIIPFDYDSNILFFPIRHHSPVCSAQILKVIKEYNPDCLLIEGPINANEIIDFLVCEETKFPIAIYYSYKDSEKILNINKDKQEHTYSCYYPMLEYSPEVVAIKKAYEMNLPVKFIDLPYSKRLLVTDNNKGIRRIDKNNYNEDYLVPSTSVAQTLCKETGFLNFDSFWEAYFEINGLDLTPKQFVEQFNAYTYTLRQSLSENELISDGTLAREQFMVDQINLAKKTYNKILVITGGFHTYGLMNEKDNKITFKNTNKEDEGIYLMPYSMEEIDAINGYASGIISPGFYQKVWDNIKAQKKYPYNEAAMSIILQTAKECKSKKILITIDDEISALNIAKGLSHLRNKNQIGKYECKDGVISSFIKGEFNQVTEIPLNILDKIYTGNTIGNIPRNSPTPPIVHDFFNRVETYKLKINDGFSKEIVLNLFSNEKHRQISRFLHSLKFLNIGFCRQIRGSDLKNEKDRNLIREVWEYEFSPLIIKRLIELSVYGSTVESASYHLLSKNIKDSNSASTCAKLLVDCFLMGINDKLTFLLTKTKEIITIDDDFFSCGEALSYLLNIYSLRELYGEVDNLDYIKLIKICFIKTLNTLEFVKNCSDIMEQSCIKTIKLLYDVALKDEFSNFKEDLIENFTYNISEDTINPVVLGSLQGILYSLGSISNNYIVSNFNSYIVSKDYTLIGAKFLSGLFYTAKDIIFVGNEFICCINDMLINLTSDDFIQILPDFRMAFSNFTPSEINYISRIISKVINIENKLLNDKGISDDTLAYGELLNDYLLNKLKEDF